MKLIQLFILTAASVYSLTFKPTIQCIVEDNHSDTTVEQLSNTKATPLTEVELLEYGLIPVTTKPIKKEYNPFDAIPSFK